MPLITHACRSDGLREGAFLLAGAMPGDSISDCLPVFFYPTGKFLIRAPFLQIPYSPAFHREPALLIPRPLPEYPAVK